MPCGEDLAALGLGPGDGALHAVEGLGGDERSDEGVLVERVADGELGVRGRQSGDEGVGDVAVDDEAAQGGAALSGGARGGEDDALDGEVEIRGGRDDGRVVAAELQQAPSETGRDAGTDLAAHAGRAGGADERDARVVHELLADGAVPQQQPVYVAGAPTSSAACVSSRSQASEMSGVSSDGFQITVSPQARATAVFHDHTAAGKLNAEMTPTTPSGCQVSARRWPGRSEAMVRP